MSDIENKIDQIKELLGKDNMSESLSNIISMIGKQKENSQDSNNESPKKSDSGVSFDPETLKMLFKIKNIMSAMKKNEDPREKLLFALKPYMNKNRQETIDNCINILKVANMMDVIKNLEGSEKNESSN